MELISAFGAPLEQGAGIDRFPAPGHDAERFSDRLELPVGVDRTVRLQILRVAWQQIFVALRNKIVNTVVRGIMIKFQGEDMP